MRADPRRVAGVLSRYLPLRVLEPPIDLPELSLALIWHRRLEKDPASRLFRRTIVDAVGASTGPVSH
jgi:hypothetical protein